MIKIGKSHGGLDGCRTFRNLYLLLPNARPVPCKWIFYKLTLVPQSGWPFRSLVRRVELTGATPLPTLSRNRRGRNNQRPSITLRLIQRDWPSRRKAHARPLSSRSEQSDIVSP